MKHLKKFVECPVCAKRFSSISVCNRHLRKIHEIKPFADLNLRNEEVEPQNGTIGNLCKSTKEFPHMANSLSLAENVVFGTHVVANCELNARQVVMATPAFAIIECLSSTDSRCFSCGKANNSGFIQCLHCSNLWFCGKRCSASKIHQSKCNEIFDRGDCYILRLVYEIIKSALEQFPDLNAFFDFCSGLLFSAKQSKMKYYRQCKPPYSTYGEILQLEKCEKDEHFKIAQRAKNYILKLPQLLSFNRQDLPRIVFYLAYRHATSLEHYLFFYEIPC